MIIIMNALREVEVYFILYFVFKSMDYKLYSYCVFHLYFRGEHDAIEYLIYLIKNRSNIIYKHNNGGDDKRFPGWRPKILEEMF